KIETTIADVKVRAHTFAFTYPVMTERYKIPNPCTSCHADKSTAWATEALRQWPERSPWRMEGCRMPFSRGVLARVQGASRALRLGGAGERPRVQKADPSYRWLIDGLSGGLFCGGGVAIGA